MPGFTDEEYAIAKSVDLVQLAEEMGYQTKRVGSRYSLKAMDSVIIFDRKSWYRYSESVGGSQIDFLMYFSGMEFKEAVNFLLKHEGYHKGGEITEEWREKLKHRRKAEAKAVPEKKAFVLPEPAGDSRCMYAYLMKTRMLSRQVIDYFVRQGLIYESTPYHNIVFLGRDKDGIVRFASQRGTRDKFGKSYKGDVPGNDKTYGFNIIHEDSGEICVFEGAIDMMSYMDYYQDYHSNMLALGMVSDGPLEKLLKEQPHIKHIRFCLDNDKAGHKAVFKLMRKYAAAGYEVDYRFPPIGKDFNEFLSYKKSLGETKKQISYHGEHHDKKAMGEERAVSANLQKKDFLYSPARPVTETKRKEPVSHRR